MLIDLIRLQKSYLDTFFGHLDLVQVQHLLDLMLQCQGVFILSGVGKSVLVAQKIAGTLTSTGSKALFLSPTDALHCDLGIVGPADLVLFFSKSWESDELLQMIPFVRNKGSHLVALVCTEQSRLARACHTAVLLPCEKEVCPFDLVPTTSAAIQMIFGDLLAVALMKAKAFSLEEYARNHPAGKIGKRIAVKVSDIMLPADALPLCHRDAKVVDTLVELSDKRCGCLLIVDQMRRLLGIFTDGDLRRALQCQGADALQTDIGTLMSCQPRWIASDELAWRAAAVMESDQQRPVAVLPVLDHDGVVIGLVKMHDIIQAGLC